MKAKISTLLTASVLAVAGVLAPIEEASAVAPTSIAFPLTRPKVATQACAPFAKGVVQVKTLGNVEVMDVVVEGLPSNTEFDLFVIQVPNAPFGMSWYQGDMHTNGLGKAVGRFVGRFNRETFIVAPKTAAAPHVHKTDAASNPPTAPVHTYHVGLWFNSPADAVKAGCPGLKTPFNGEHNAGVQVLNTGRYPDTFGPLIRLNP